MKKRLSILLSLLIALSCFNNIYADCGSNDGNDSEQGTNYSFIKYYKNDGSDSYTSQQFNDNEITVLDLSNKPTRDGYTLINWNTHADGSGYTFVFKGAEDEVNVAVAGEEETGINYNAIKRDADLTLYAQWDKLTLTYDANDGSNETSTQTCDRNNSINLKNNFENNTYMFSPAINYEFAGWNTVADGSGTSYAAGDNFDIKYDITLYAQWRKINYTITFDANGGNLQESFNNPITVSASNAKLPSEFPTPTKADCTFDGWYLDDGFINAATASADITDDVTLYAKWSTNYVVSINETNYTFSQFLNEFNGLSGNINVTLLNDVNLDTDNLNIVAGQNVTLDLNGHSISSSTKDTIYITGGNLTINDSSSGAGKVVSGKNALYCVNKTDTPINITINGGSFEAKNWAFYINYDNNKKVCNNITINPGAGEFKSTTTNAYGALRIACPGTYQIKGGTYSGKKSLLINAEQKVDDSFEVATLFANVQISGGTFNSLIDYSAGLISVKGGRFVEDAYLGDDPGYKATKEGEYYVVEMDSEASAAAKIGDVVYYSLQDAIDASTSGQTIVLVADDSENLIVNEDKNITIDLNGYDLYSGLESTVLNYGVLNIKNTNTEDPSYIVSGTSSNNSCINNVGTLTIGDNILLSGYYNVYNIGTIEYSAKTYGAACGLYMDAGNAKILDGGLGGTISVYVSGGTLTIDGGKVISTNNRAIVMDNNGKLIVNGGTIYSQAEEAIELSANSEVEINGGIIYSTEVNAISTYDNTKLTINGENTSIYSTKENEEALYISEDSSVVINNGQISSDKDEGIYLRDNATLKINGGIIQGSTNADGIMVEGCDLLEINGGTIRGKHGLYIFGGNININNGNILSTNDTIIVDGWDLDNEYNIILNITGGNIASDNDNALYAGYVSSKEHQIPLITITGGYFKSGAGEQTIAKDDEFDGKISISGGYYSNTFDSSFIASNYYLASTSNKTYPYAVRKVVVYDNDDTKDTTTEKKQSTTTTKVKTETKTVISSTETLIKKVDGTSIRQITTKDDSQVILESDSKIIPTGTILEKSSLSSDSEEYKQVQTIIESDETLSQAKDIVVYNFDLIEDNGTKIHELDGYVEVSLPVPDELKSDNNQKIVVYRVNEDGSLTKCETTVTDGVITFKTNHFSTYIFVLENDEPVNEVINNATDVDITTDTNNHSNVLPIVLISLFVVIVLVALIVLRKRNRK